MRRGRDERLGMSGLSHLAWDASVASCLDQSGHDALQGIQVGLGNLGDTVDVEVTQGTELAALV